MVAVYPHAWVTLFLLPKTNQPYQMYRRDMFCW